LFRPSLISRRATFAEAPARQGELISGRSHMYSRKFGSMLQGKWLGQLNRLLAKTFGVEAEQPRIVRI